MTARVAGLTKNEGAGIHHRLVVCPSPNVRHRQRYNHVTVTVGWSLLSVFYGAVTLALLYGLVHTTTGLP